MIAYSYYGNKIRAEFEDPNYMEQKYVADIYDKSAYLMTHI